MYVQSTPYRLMMMTGIVAVFATGNLGCQWGMVNTNARVRKHSVNGDFDKALAAMQARKRSDFKAHDSVMYWMNEGMLLHLTGQHKQAIQALSLAEARARELFTRSVSRHVQAAFTSNAALDYAGEDHEKVLIHVVKALGFLALDDRDGALVEARKINRALEYMNTLYKQHDNSYSEDAFAHWIMGMLFELEGSHDDARIAFNQSRTVYDQQFAKRYGTSAPSWLMEDVARAAVTSGDTALLQALRIEAGDGNLGHTAELLRTHGELVLIHLNGEGPTKTDKYITCYYHEKALVPRCDHTPGGSYLISQNVDAARARAGVSSVTVAFPRPVTREPVFDSIALSSGDTRAVSEIALPIDRIALDTMRDKLPRVFEKAVVRAVTKAASRKAADKASRKLAGNSKAGGVLGFAMRLGADTALSATEEADKRAWTTLPARIEVARLWLPAGRHDVALALKNGKTRTLSGVAIKPGERVFITHRTIP